MTLCSRVAVASTRTLSGTLAQSSHWLQELPSLRLEAMQRG